MKKIFFERRPGYFITTIYSVSSLWGGDEHPKLCSSTATRLFKLKPGQSRIVAIATKTPPKKCAKYYEIIETQYPWDTRRRMYCALKGFNGGFMRGVQQALTDLYAEEYRYVRLENAS